MQLYLISLAFKHLMLVSCMCSVAVCEAAVTAAGCECPRQDTQYSADGHAALAVWMAHGWYPSLVCGSTQTGPRGPLYSGGLSYGSVVY